MTCGLCCSAASRPSLIPPVCSIACAERRAMPTDLADVEEGRSLQLRLFQWTGRGDRRGRRGRAPGCAVRGAR